MKHTTLTLIILMLFNFNTQAAVIFVDNDEDLMQLDGNCDLRDAINSANINISIDGCTAGEFGVQDVVIIQVNGPIQLANSLPVFSSIYIGTSFGVDPVEVRAAPNKRIMRVSPNSVNDNNFAIVNLRFTGGNATDEITGGAIYLTGVNANLGVVEINGMEFDGNHSYEGGALHFDNTRAESVYINNNTFTNNSADIIGGAISGYNMVTSGTGSFFRILRSHFDSNMSAGSTGAVFLRDQEIETIEISSNQFINNSATSDVGAIQLAAIVDNQTYLLERNLFMFNQSGGAAGALQVSFSAIAQVNDSLFAYNAAERGGAVTSVLGNALLRLSSSTLVHNSATLAGDNIYIYGTGRLLPSRNIVAYPVNGDNCAGSLGTTPAASFNNNITDDGTCELLDNVSLTEIADPLLTGFSIDFDLFPGFAPTLNSPALDGTSTCGDEDVMGRNRPQDGDGNGTAACDIGAIESPTAVDVVWGDSFGL